jgi:hypothetical protein
MPYRWDHVTRRSFGLTLVTASCASTLAFAQPADTGDSKGEPEEAEAPGEAKPDEPAQTPPPAPAATPEPTDKNGASPNAPLGDFDPRAAKFTTVVFGYLRVQYMLVQNDPNVAFIGRNDGFQVQNARVGMRGNYRDAVRYVFSLDGAVDERSQQNTPQGTLRVGLRDAFADVVTSNKQLFFRGGFFQSWADPNRLVADTVREFVDRPLWSRGMRSTEGWYTDGLTAGRSIGAAVRLEPVAANQVGVEVAVQNGADEFSSNNDNDLPSASATVMFRLPDDGFVVAGARYNPRTVGELPFRQDETDLQGYAGIQINTSAVRIGGGGIVQRTTFQSTNGPMQNAFGAHAQAAFRIPASSPVFVGYRFAILDPSSLVVTDRIMEHTAGVTVSVPSVRMRVQFQATHVVEQADRELSNTRVQIAGEVAL